MSVKKMSIRKEEKAMNMKLKLRVKCPYCSHWNRIEVHKIFVEQPSKESKVQVLIPMYKPLEISKCKKCGKIIAEPKELIRIVKG